MFSIFALYQRLQNTDLAEWSVAAPKEGFIEATHPVMGEISILLSNTQAHMPILLNNSPLAILPWRKPSPTFERAFRDLQTCLQLSRVLRLQHRVLCALYLIEDVEGWQVDLRKKTLISWCGTAFPYPAFLEDQDADVLFPIATLDDPLSMSCQYGTFSVDLRGTRHERLQRPDQLLAQIAPYL